MNIKSESAQVILNQQFSTLDYVRVTDRHVEGDHVGGTVTSRLM